LGRCCLFPYCDFAEQIDQGLIRFASLLGKPRERAPQVGTVERSVFTDLSREEASAERAKWNETDSEFLERRERRARDEPFALPLQKGRSA